MRRMSRTTLIRQGARRRPTGRTRVSRYETRYRSARAAAGRGRRVGSSSGLPIPSATKGARVRLRGRPVRGGRRPRDDHHQPPGSPERLPAPDHPRAGRGLRGGGRRRGGRGDRLHRRGRAGLLRRRRRARPHPHRGRKAQPAPPPRPPGTRHPQQRQADHREGARLLHRRRQRAQRPLRPDHLGRLGQVRPGRSQDRLGAPVVGLPAAAPRPWARRRPARSST